MSLISRPIKGWPTALNLWVRKFYWECTGSCGITPSDIDTHPILCNRVDERASLKTNQETGWRQRSSWREDGNQRMKVHLIGMTNNQSRRIYDHWADDEEWSEQKKLCNTWTMRLNANEDRVWVDCITNPFCWCSHRFSANHSWVLHSVAVIPCGLSAHGCWRRAEQPCLNCLMRRMQHLAYHPVICQMGFTLPADRWCPKSLVSGAAKCVPKRSGMKGWSVAREQIAANNSGASGTK